MYLEFEMGFPYYHWLTLERIDEGGMHVDEQARKDE
jgi:hypothetical protein